MVVWHSTRAPAEQEKAAQQPTWAMAKETSHSATIVTSAGERNIYVNGTAN
jgi:hypothetical protein